MIVEPIGNAIQTQEVGNRLEAVLIDVHTVNFFLTTLQTASEHKEVGAIDNV